MPLERQRLPAPRERTFAELFPWRNMRRAAMLVLLIVAIVAIKRSTAPLLSRVGTLWGSPATEVQQQPNLEGAVRRIRLGPGLAPRSTTVTDGR